MIRKLLSTVAFTAAITSAQAEIPGLFLGIHAYGAMWNDRIWYTGPTGQTGLTKVVKYTAKNFGAHSGYLLEIGDTKLVTGIEVYKDKFKTKPLSRSLISGGNSFGTVFVSRDTETGVSAIFGKLINPKILVYALFRVANVKNKLTFSGVTFPVIGSQTVQANFKNVKVPGIGMVYQVAKHVQVGAEFLYMNLFNNSAVPIPNVTYKPIEYRLRFFIRAKV